MGTILAKKNFILENPIVKVIFGNVLIEKMKRIKFPIEYPIHTPEYRKICWSRLTSNKNKANGFQKLVNEYLEKGYLEKSNLLWCHPVVVVQKKSGEYRFTLDLTKLNDLVELDEFTFQK